jgi:RimJ/RimL family protein N-acetyltransferase
VLEIVTAEEASLDPFMSVATPYAPQLSEYVDSLLDTGRTRPAWCLVALDSGVPAARAALWSTGDVPTDVVVIDGDWDEPSASNAVLVRAHGLAAALGARELMHHLDTPPGPPQYQEHDDARARLLTDAGYDLLRDGLRWRYAGPSSVTPPPSLTFRGLSEVGEEAFVDAIASTYKGTPDTWLTQEIEERGLVGAARADFDAYREMEYQPGWWELGYAEDGSVGGVILAAKIPGAAVIGYVGVTPPHRGRGLAAQLVRRGTDHLVAAGEDEIRGDCDRGNVPMVKAFERAGYESFARRRSYRRTLP